MNKVISLFSGAGGMDIGFSNAGFDISVSVEQETKSNNINKQKNCFKLAAKVIEHNILGFDTKTI